MRRRKWFDLKDGRAPLAGILLGAFLSHGAVAQVTTDSYFDAPKWAEDDYGWYDERFDWDTNDSWYDRWNDTDVTVWTAPPAERAQWDLLGYDDAGEAGAFDW